MTANKGANGGGPSRLQQLVRLAGRVDELGSLGVQPP